MDKISESQVKDRQERVEVYHNNGFEREVHVVEDLNAEKRLVVRKFAQLIWLIFGSVNALIGIRVLLKLMAANPENPFAQLVYSVSDLFLWPFLGLTMTPAINGIVLEIPALIAIFVYAVAGWILVRLVWLLFYNPASRTVRTTEKEHDRIQ